MALLDDLRALLTRHHEHVQSRSQQGTARLIDGHLKRLDAAAGADVDKADAEAHAVLGELYGGLNAPAEPAPAGPAKTTTKKAANTPPATDKA